MGSIKKRLNRLPRPIHIGLLAILALVVVITALELSNVTYIFHEKPATSSTIEATNPNQSSGDSNQSSDKQVSTSSPNPSSPDTPTSNKSTQPATSDGAAPATPSGSFVSNHSPNLGGSPAPSQIQSVCLTTVGASCTIEFAKDGVTKTLSSQVADSNGAVYWTWDVKQSGFSVGEWRITAKATLNGKTTSATDSINLKVQP